MSDYDDAETEAEKESDTLETELNRMATVLGLLFFGLPVLVAVSCAIFIQIFER